MAGSRGHITEGVRRSTRCCAEGTGGGEGRFAEKGWQEVKRWSRGIGKAGKEGEPAVRQVAEGWRAECGRLVRSRPGGWRAQEVAGSALVRQSLQWARQWGETLGSARESRGRPFLSRVGVPFPTNHNLHATTLPPATITLPVSYPPESHLPPPPSAPRQFVAFPRNFTHFCGCLW